MENKKENQINGNLEKMLKTPTAQKGEGEILFSRSPKKALQEMRDLVKTIASQCTGPEFIADIGDKRYPRVEWWTTLGAALGLFPVVSYSRRLKREDEIAYEARVEVRHGEIVVAAGEALCSNREPTWKEAPEYSLKSMAITRATGKAYRIPLSFLAVMSGLAPTNAEEIPNNGTPNPSEANPRKATVRQLDYLLWLAQQKYGDGEGYRRIENHARVKYGHEKGTDLLKTEASTMIDTLMSGKDLAPPLSKGE